MQIEGTITSGYRIASGLTSDTPFPDGTIKLQSKFFKERGFDLEEEIPDLYWGTLNIDISPINIKVVNPDYKFEDVKWTDHIASETFSFVRVGIVFNEREYNGFIYYPHPETKPNCYDHKYNRLEILSEKIPDIQYGRTVEVCLRKGALEILSDECCS